MHNPEVSLPYDAQNLIRLIDSFFDAFGPEAVRGSSVNRKYEQSIMLKRDKVFRHCANTGDAHLTRPIPVEMDAALETWLEFGGHRVSFYDSYHDGTGTTTDYFIQGAEIMKQQIVSRPWGFGLEGQRNLDQLDALRDIGNVHAHTIATYGLMRKIDGDDIHQTVSVGQDELENLLSWMGGAAPSE